MRELSEAPTPLDSHCMIGSMAAAGFAVGCGLAACGPMLLGAASMGTPEPAWLARAGAHLSMAGAAAWACWREVGRQARGVERPSVALRLFLLTVAAWALLSAVHEVRANEAIWVASQGFASAASLLLVCAFLGDEVDLRLAQVSSCVTALACATAGPLAWWAGELVQSAGDLRIAAGTQAVALTMLAVGMLHQGLRSRSTRRAAAASVWLALSLGVQWSERFSLLGGSTGAASLLQAGAAAACMLWCAFGSGMPAGTRSQLASRADGLSREPPAAGAMSASKQRMAS